MSVASAQGGSPVAPRQCHALPQRASGALRLVLAVLSLAACSPKTPPPAAPPAPCSFGIASPDAIDFPTAAVLVQPTRFEGQRVRIRGHFILVGAMGGALLQSSKWDDDFAPSPVPTPSLFIGKNAAARGSVWTMDAVWSACSRRDVVIEGTVRIPPPPTFAPDVEGLVDVTRIEALSGEPYLLRPGVSRSLILRDATGRPAPLLPLPSPPRWTPLPAYDAPRRSAKRDHPPHGYGQVPLRPPS